MHSLEFIHVESLHRRLRKYILFYLMNDLTALTRPINCKNNCNNRILRERFKMVVEKLESENSCASQ